MSTGSDMRYASTPSRSTPIATRTTPTMSASKIARRTYSAVPMSARFESAPKVNSEVSATGPV